MTKTLVLLKVMLFLVAAPALATELAPFYRGVRPAGMGDAFTAVADDADSVFYNPAGMALQRSYEARLINPKFDISTDDAKILTQLRGFQLDGPTLNKLFGEHIYGNMTAFPSLIFPNFTLGYYYSAGAHIVSRNPSFPQIDAAYMRDRGPVGGFAYETRGFSKRHFMRWGFTGKLITRNGFHKVIPLTNLVTADKTYVSTLDSASATGFGASMGFQYEIPINRKNDIIFAAAWQDIGDTQFGNSLQANRPPPIQNNLAAGLAWITRFGGFRSANNLKLTGELQHLAQGNVDPRLKLHVGAELSVGPVSVQGGVNQDSLTGGARVDLLHYLEASVVTYGVENQALAFMDRERRYMFQLTLKFDVMGRGSLSKRDDDRRKHPRDY